MMYKKRLILFICTNHGLWICHDKTTRYYEVRTNEKYKLFLYLSVVKYPSVYKSLYFTALLISQEEKYKDPYTSNETNLVLVGPTVGPMYLRSRRRTLDHVPVLGLTTT